MKRVVFLDHHREAFAGLAPRPKRSMRAALRSLASGEGSLDVKKLAGLEEPTLYRLRVGQHRAVYYETADQTVVLRIFHRSQGYGWLE